MIDELTKQIEINKFYDLIYGYLEEYYTSRAKFQ